VRENKKTKHHIIPRSRNGGSLKSNIVKVKHDEHDRYHALFENKTPEEILYYLTNTFWGGNYKIIKDFIKGNGI